MQNFSNTKKLLNAEAWKQELDIRVIADKLNFLIDSQNITTKILSNATGISIAAINNLKRGEGNPTIGTLNTISSFFGISLIEFLGLGNSAHMQNASVIVPVFDLRHADQRKEDNILNKMLIEKPKNCSVSDIFAVLINNNYLLPLYEKGTIFLLSSSREAIDGDIVLVRIQDSTNAIKRIFIKKDNYYLKNINIDETLDLYSKKDLAIIGIVSQIIQKTS